MSPPRRKPIDRLTFNHWHEILYEGQWESRLIEIVAVQMLARLASTFEEWVDLISTADRFHLPAIRRLATVRVLRQASTFDEWHYIWYTGGRSRLSRRAFRQALKKATSFKQWGTLAHSCRISNDHANLVRAVTEMCHRAKSFTQWLETWEFTRGLPDLRASVRTQLDRYMLTDAQRAKFDRSVVSERQHNQILRARGLPEQ